MVFHDWSIIKQGNILYLLDGSIFAVLFETTSHSFHWLSLLVWLKKRPCILVFFSVKFSSHVGCPPSGAKEWQNMAVTRVSHSCLLIELGAICNSMAASLWLKSCEDHSLLKSYNGGIWKNNYRSGHCGHTTTAIRVPSRIPVLFSSNPISSFNHSKTLQNAWVSIDICTSNSHCIF